MHFELNIVQNVGEEEQDVHMLVVKAIKVFDNATERFELSLKTICMIT